MARDELARLRTVADYQFGAGAGAALFPDDDLEVTRSTSGRPRQVHGPGGRVVTYGTDGRFTLGLEGGRRLVDALAPPRARVVVGAERDPFVREGRNAFAKFVRDVDADVRPGDEVAVVCASGDGAGDDDGAAGDDDDGVGTGDGTDDTDGGDTPGDDDGPDGPVVAAVGRAELPADAMFDFDTGVAVAVREGAGSRD